MYIWDVHLTGDVINKDNTPQVNVRYFYNNGNCDRRCSCSTSAGWGTINVLRDSTGEIAFLIEDCNENLVDPTYVFPDKESKERIMKCVEQEFVVKPIEFIFGDEVYHPPVKNDYMDADGYYTIPVQFINHTCLSGATIYLTDGKATGAFTERKDYPFYLRAFVPMYYEPDVTNAMWKKYIELGGKSNER